MKLEFQSPYGTVTATVEPNKITFRTTGDFTINRIDCNAHAVYVLRTEPHTTNHYNGWELKDYSRDGLDVSRPHGLGIATYSARQKWEELTKTLLPNCLTAETTKQAILDDYTQKIQDCENRIKQLETELAEEQHNLQNLTNEKRQHLRDIMRKSQHE